MMRTVYKIVLTLICTSVYAQKDDKLMRFPQSPEVQTFQKNFDHPVSLHNGTADVSVLLFNLNIGKKMVFPLALSYNTSGIKVNERAGSVGLGWNLSNPGVIVRNTKGQADNMHSLSSAYFDLKTNVYNKPLSTTIRTDDNLFEPRLTNDYEPDEYIVSFLGTTFKLVFDGSISGSNLEEKFVQMPLTENKVKAKINSSGFIFGWEITDPLGNLYYFGSESDGTSSAIEFQNPSTIYSFGTPTDDNPSSGTYAKAWYLIKINTAENSNIAQFIYADKGKSTTANIIGETSYACPRVFVNNYEENLTMMELCATQSQPASSFSYSIQSNDDLYLDQIITDSTRIKFNHEQFRSDLPGSKSLDNIEITSHKVNIIKRIEFNYSYFQPILVDDCSLNKLSATILNSYVSADAIRLKLDNVVERYEGINSQTLPLMHSFDYTSTTLPNAMSFARDHWGYYNGRHSNCGLLPNLSLAIDVGTYLIGKNERRASEDHSKYGMLSKIKYPTGGSVFFTYEKNITSSFLNTHENYALPPRKSISQTGEQALNENGEIFYLDVDIDLQFSYNNLITLREFEKEYNPEGRAYYGNLYIESPSDPNFGKKLFALGPNYNNVQLIKNETYKITCQVDPAAFFDYMGNPFTPNEGVSLMLDWPDYNPDQIDKMDGGGLRISQVIYKNETDEIVSKKTYDYKNSGVGMNEPLYVDPFYAASFNSIAYPISKLYGLAEMPNSSSFTDNVYYNEVSVYNINVKDDTKTRTDYEFMSLSNADVLMSIYNPNNNLDAFNPKVTFKIPLRHQFTPWRIGKIIKQIDYVSRSNIYEPLKMVEIDYDLIKNFYLSHIFGLRLEKRAVITQLTSYFPIPHNLYNWEFYSLYTEGFDKSSSKITEYYNNGNTLVTKTLFNYSSPYHDLLTSEKIVFPDLTSFETSYAYAQDKGNQILIAANIIGIPLEVEVRKDKKVISKNVTNYDNSDNLVPSSVASLDLQSNSHIVDITYDFYDDKRNLLQFTMKSGITTAIIWGYNKTQPIAKIEGASYAQVSALANSIIAASDSDAGQLPNNDETAFLDLLDNFRKNLPDFQITTYTYDPLIGVRSITPPSGIREYYIYDTANRLQSVKDINGKILKEYKYNYKP